MCQRAGWIQKFKWMLTLPLKMQSRCFGSNQKVLHLSHRRRVLAEIMFGLVLLSQTMPPFQNNGEIILPILQITSIWESLHSHKVSIWIVLSGLTCGQIERRRLKNQGVGPDNSQQGQAVVCMGEKQSNSSWSVNIVMHFKRGGQSIQGYGRCARLVSPSNLKLMTGTEHRCKIQLLPFPNPTVYMRYSRIMNSACCLINTSVVFTVTIHIDKTNHNISRTRKNWKKIMLSAPS